MTIRDIRGAIRSLELSSRPLCVHSSLRSLIPIAVGVMMLLGVGRFLPAEIMEAIRIHKIVEKDGEILVTGLPYKKGQSIEVILLPESSTKSMRKNLTARELFNSGLIGLWKDREDIKDSADYARQLREKAQNRRG